MKSLRELIKQLFRFGIVGGLATLMNSGIFLLLVKIVHFPPLLGNLLAFLFAFLISYFGHFIWTFENKEHNYQKLIKFFIIALLGLGINTGFIWWIMHVLHQSAFIAILPMLFVTPLIVFFINRTWVFNDPSLREV